VIFFFFDPCRRTVSAAAIGTIKEEVVVVGETERRVAKEAERMEEEREKRKGRKGGDIVEL
jgi:hypothetical protein